MRASKGLYVHIGLLALAGVSAVGVWTREKQPKALSAGDVVVWSSKGDVESVRFEGKSKTVTLEAKKDAVGRYFVGSVDKVVTPPPPQVRASKGEVAARVPELVQGDIR